MQIELNTKCVDQNHTHMDSSERIFNLHHSLRWVQTDEYFLSPLDCIIISNPIAVEPLN